ncbi:MAG: hypothetical protein EOP06_16145 [Proteobacteria bacterium]|nr:MAG: hypothetical protein EOP06_16145 [Pseudomonadota bacterium]
MNSDIERPEQYGRSLAGLGRLVVSGQDILGYLSTTDVGQVGFSPQQVQEEVLKAKLLLANPGWESRINSAERHGYFNGQIEFILDFCGVIAKSKEEPVGDWSQQDHQELQQKFDDYAKKAAIMFDKDGLAATSASSVTHLWKRALLARGNYMMHTGSNRSFLNNPASYPGSWKRFLRDGEKRKHLKSLWDEIHVEKEIEPQLNEIIAGADGLEPWRAAVVKHPEIIQYCGKQEARWHYLEKEIYLLAKSQMNGTHAELFSYALYLELKDGSKVDLSPLTLHPYQSVTTSETEPYVLLTSEADGRRTSFSIKSEGGQFRISVVGSGLSAMPDFQEYLRAQVEFSESGLDLTRLVSRDDIHFVLGQLTQKLREMSLGAA